jgi:hypothetical protein
MAAKKAAKKSAKKAAKKTSKKKYRGFRQHFGGTRKRPPKVFLGRSFFEDARCVRWLCGFQELRAWN